MATTGHLNFTLNFTHCKSVAAKDGLAALPLHTSNSCKATDTYNSNDILPILYFFALSETSVSKMYEVMLFLMLIVMYM